MVFVDMNLFFKVFGFNCFVDKFWVVLFRFLVDCMIMFIWLFVEMMLFDCLRELVVKFL